VARRNHAFFGATYTLIPKLAYDELRTADRGGPSKLTQWGHFEIAVALGGKPGVG